MRLRSFLLNIGYAGTTIDAVATAAGVSRKTVFDSVGGKAQLMKLAYDFAIVGDDEPVPLVDRPEMSGICSPSPTMPNGSQCTRLSWWGSTVGFPRPGVPLRARDQRPGGGETLRRDGRQRRQAMQKPAQMFATLGRCDLTSTLRLRQT